MAAVAGAGSSVDDVIAPGGDRYGVPNPARVTVDGTILSEGTSP
jgi:hypothetical protein